MARKTNRKDPNLFGLHSKTFPVSVREYVDCDYLDQLSEEDKQWMATFLDRHYAADHRVKDDPWTDADRKASYVRKNRANQDILAAARQFNLVEDLTAREDLKSDPSAQDFRPTPEYLNDPEYKAAREEFRSHLAQGNKAIKPKPSEKLDAARVNLENLTDGQEEV